MIMARLLAHVSLASTFSPVYSVTWRSRRSDIYAWTWRLYFTRVTLSLTVH